MSYIDAFLLVVAKKNLAAYKALSTKAGKLWKEFGALDYRECVGDDLACPGMISFTKRVNAKKNEVVVFSWILYRSKAQRNQVNKKIMNDPRIPAMMTGKPPFDMKRMSMGGFKTIVHL